MTERILNHFPHLESHTYYYNWLTEDLKDMLILILQKCNQNLCIFIDGLGEICYRGILSKLTQLIDESLRFPHIKMCIASRPDTTIMSWLGKKKGSGFLLEDLAKRDRENFMQELNP